MELKNVREYIKNENGLWLGYCQLFTDVFLTHRLMRIHYSKHIPICYGTENKYNKDEIKSSEFFDGTLLNYIKNSSKIIQTDYFIKIIKVK